MINDPRKENTNFEEIILEKLKVVYHDSEILERFKYGVEDKLYIEKYLERMLLRIEKEIYGIEKNRKQTVPVKVLCTVNDNQELDVAASWFQQLKIDCAPRWFNKLFPVKYKKRTVYFSKTETIRTAVEMETCAKAYFPELKSFQNSMKIVMPDLKWSQVDR